MVGEYDVELLLENDIGASFGSQRSVLEELAYKISVGECCGSCKQLGRDVLLFVGLDRGSGGSNNRHCNHGRRMIAPVEEAFSIVSLVPLIMSVLLTLRNLPCIITYLKFHPVSGSNTVHKAALII